VITLKNRLLKWLLLDQIVVCGVFKDTQSFTISQNGKIDNIYERIAGDNKESGRSKELKKEGFLPNG